MLKDNWIEHFWIFDNIICQNSSSIDNFQNGSCLQRPIFAIGLVSDLASMFGALLIVLSFYIMKDLRTIARYFLLFISVADFFNAFFFMTAHIWSLADPGYSICYENKSDIQKYYCVAQSAFNVFFSLVSYFWTTILAIHVVLLITIQKQTLGKKCVFRTLVAIGTIFPFIVSVLALILNRLGPGFDTVSAGWCFVGYHKNHENEGLIHNFSELMTGKIWDMIALVSISILNLIALFYLIYHRIKSKMWKSTEQDLKLILIPIAYLFLRFWGYFRWVIQFQSPSPIKSLPEYCEYFTFLIYLQAIGDPGQGWANAILFLFMTRAVRGWVVTKCRCVARKRTTRTPGFTYTSSTIKNDTSKLLESLVSNVNN